MKFKNIYKETKENVEMALLSLWAPGKHRMRSALKDLFKREPLMAEPVFQSIFPWTPTTDKNWESYLDKDVINIQRDKAASRGETFVPFQHQSDSWRELKSGNSIVVTSGTGSGKTECFMLPVLSDLHSRANTPVGNTPVEAIFLYPLNALMQDQKDRLGKDCQKLGLRFAVYNRSLKDRKATGTANKDYLDAEVRTRDNVRHENQKGAPSCPQIILTNPSMLEYMLVRDSDQSIFERSKGKLRWIVIDEAHTYSGSAAVELSYLIRRVLEAFGVTRDQVRFVCTSATIGDKSRPQELTDFIETITGKYSQMSKNKLVTVSGDRLVPSVSNTDIDIALKNNGLTTIQSSDILTLRDLINKKPMNLSSMMKVLNLGGLDIESALSILDSLCEIQFGKEYLLMLRGHFFMRTIGGLFGCINDGCSAQDNAVNSGFHYLTTYKGNGRCPHCGAPLFEIVQCGDCKEFIVECLENDDHELRISYSRPEDISVDSDSDSDDNDDGGTQGGQVEENWRLLYLAWFGGGRSYTKPHPDFVASRMAVKWDGSVATTDSKMPVKPWVTLGNKELLYCPSCASGSGEDGSRFSNFRLSANWLNGTIAPALMKEGANQTNEWGKYIAFTDSRQGTAINAKRFNIEAERAFARNRLVTELSTPQVPPQFKAAVEALMQNTGKSQNECLQMLGQQPDAKPIFGIRDAADVMFDQRIFDHIDFESSQRNNSTAYKKDEEAYKTSIVRSIIGRRPVHLQNIENLGLVSIIYPAIDAIKGVPAGWSRANLKEADWKSFLKISLDYVIRMGNHLQAPTDTELQYLRDSDKSTPYNPAKWPVIKNGNVKTIQHRLILLLCAALGIKDKIALGQRRNEINTLLGETWTFLEKNILTKVDVNDKYYEETDDNGFPIYDGWYYLDMSLSSTVCKLAIIERAYICPVTSYVIDTVFSGYSPAIKGCVCPENISRYAIDSSTIVKMPIIGTDSFTADVGNLISAGIWNDRHKYAYLKTQHGYLTAEHSGQQNRDRLDFYTAEFKSEPHKLNLLQCSTTMEMGVDIGDIDTVLMTNVPPSTANYMQRAGRAGRRGQSKAVTFSLCPNTSIGLQVFSNPMRILAGINTASKPIESPIVIQRHMNSFFLRQFLCVHPGVKFSKIHPWLCTGGFYGGFDLWLLNHKTDLQLEQTFKGIFGSSRQMTSAIDNCRFALGEIVVDYQQTIADINNAITATSSTAKKDALSIQADALMNQEPKGYLAEQQFLPNADMPTGVVEFNYLDAYNYTKLNNIKKELENCKQKLSQPGNSQAEIHKLERKIEEYDTEISELREKFISSREIKIALSEYAPGQMIVIDERNYVSAGIEWKNSLGQKQPWKYIYHCPTCGRYEYSDNPTLTQCPNCNSVFEGILAPNSTHCTYSIEPIRFRTDVNRGINRKEHTEKIFYDIQTILTEVDWKNSIKGYMCDLVGSDDSKGEIVFFNSGKGDGFNLCLDCGRMELWKKERTPGTWIHNDITEKGKACPANNPYNHILLSGRFPTTFVSLRFYKDPSGTKYESDLELLYSLGVLLCRALTKKIGVSPDDVDFDVRQEQNYASIFMYDTQKGGCGYSSKMLDPAICHAVFVEAKTMLTSYACHCEDQVKGACVNCLIDRNSQRIEGYLSKYKLLEWFSRLQINTANLPQGVKAIPTPLKYLVTWLYSKQSVTSLTFCADASEMNLNDWANKDGEMGRVLNECVNRGKVVKILLANIPDPSKTSKVDAIIPFVDLNQKFKNWNIDVQRVDSLEQTQGRFSALIINGKEHYFTDTPDVLHFTANWGVNCTQLYEDGVIPAFKVGKFPSYNDILPLLHSGEIIRTTEFPAGTRTRIDNVFYILKQDLLKAGDEQVINDILRGKRVNITFSDTYVNSALAALMLVYLLKELRDMYSFTFAAVTLNIKSAKRNCVNPIWSDNSFISFNFPNEKDADSFIKDCFEGILGITPVFSQTVPDHYRWIRLQAEGETSYMELRPDHGISGGWQSSERYFSADFLDGSTIAELKRGVEALYYLLLKK